jgi:hypothetical protein
MKLRIEKIQKGRIKAPKCLDQDMDTPYASRRRGCILTGINRCRHNSNYNLNKNNKAMNIIMFL